MWVRLGASVLAIGTLSFAAPSLTAQAGGDVQKAVDAAFAKYRTLKEGKNADYIPALAKVDPNLFGIAVVTADGKCSPAGDLKTEVSIQSISKVFTMRSSRSRGSTSSRNASAWTPLAHASTPSSPSKRCAG